MRHAMSLKVGLRALNRTDDPLYMVCQKPSKQPSYTPEVLINPPPRKSWHRDYVNSVKTPWPRMREETTFVPCLSLLPYASGQRYLPLGSPARRLEATCGHCAPFRIIFADNCSGALKSGRVKAMCHARWPVLSTG